MKKWLIIFTLFMLPGFAMAAGRGRYLCDFCSINTAVDASSASDIIEVLSFIKSQINPSVDRWIPGDTVTVCDGVGCLLVKFLANGNWVPIGVFRDSGAQYKNAAARPSVSSNANSAPDYYEVTSTGHYEWWDFYSNGRYTGSSQPEWVYDSMNVSASSGYRYSATMRFAKM